MKFIAIIPARYASTRFPGKPLAEIGGKPMIQHVYEQAKKAVDDVVVATDDERIYDKVVEFGGRVVMTSSEHKSGTDRCFEALQKQQETFDVVINVQGDEPFINPVQIEALKACFDSTGKTEIATLIKRFSPDATYETLDNPNSPKVVVDGFGRAVYFSRSVIPYLRSVDKDKWAESNMFYKHIGVYAYRVDVLAKITELRQTPLETAESLEQLRWIENGYCIQTAVTDFETCGIDTLEDLEKARRMYLLDSGGGDF